MIKLLGKVGDYLVHHVGPIGVWSQLIVLVTLICVMADIEQKLAEVNNMATLVVLEEKSRLSGDSVFNGDTKQARKAAQDRWNYFAQQFEKIERHLGLTPDPSPSPLPDYLLPPPELIKK